MMIRPWPWPRARRPDSAAIELLATNLTRLRADQARRDTDHTAVLAAVREQHRAQLAEVRRQAGRAADQAAARIADLAIDLAIARHALHEADAAGVVPGDAAVFARRHEQLAADIVRLTAANTRLQRLAAAYEERLAAVEGRPATAGAL